MKVLRHTDKDFYPNIHALLVIITTLPVTSCECERSISLLRHLKTSLRSTMGEDRLNSLALLKCHREVDIDPEEVVEEFSHRHPRRMLLTNHFVDSRLQTNAHFRVLMSSSSIKLLMIGVDPCTQILLNCLSQHF